MKKKKNLAPPRSNKQKNDPPRTKNKQTCDLWFIADPGIQYLLSGIQYLLPFTFCSVNFDPNIVPFPCMMDQIEIPFYRLHARMVLGDFPNHASRQKPFFFGGGGEITKIYCVQGAEYFTFASKK